MEIVLEYLPIVVSSFVVYMFMIIGLRFFGKKELAQLSVPDLVFVLLISNAVQNAMVGTNSTLSGGIVAASTLFLTNHLFKYILYKFPTVQELLQGQPLVLVYKGKVNDDNLKKMKITMDELMETIREHGTKSVEEVDLAMMEVDGNISVLSDNFKNKTVQGIKKRKHPHGTNIGT